MIDMGPELEDRSVGIRLRWDRIPALADGKRSQPSARLASFAVATAKDRLAFKHVVCRPARSSRGSAEIDRMRPAPAPVRHPRRTEIQPPGVPGLSGLLTLAVGGRRAGGALCRGRRCSCPSCSPSFSAFVLAPFVDVMRRWHHGPRTGRHHRGARRPRDHPVPGRDHRLSGRRPRLRLPRYQTTIESKVGSLQGRHARAAAGSPERFRPPASTRPSPSRRRSSSAGIAAARSAPPPRRAVGPAAGGGPRARTDAGPDGAAMFCCRCSSRWPPRASCSWC